MIESITLKFGRTPSATAEPITVMPITIFVGPNNSGKSKVIQEIFQFCLDGSVPVTNKLLSTLRFGNHPAEHIDKLIESITLNPRHEDGVQPGQMVIGRGGARRTVNSQTFLTAISNPDMDRGTYASYFTSHYTLKIDGSGRIDLVNPQDAGDLQQPGVSSLQVLFRKDALRAEVRRILLDAFGQYFVIDPTQVGTLRIRYSARPPIDNSEERSWEDKAVTFHGQASPINEFSDGVKAFTGIITQVIAGDPRILLIDEPEAFLHPPLAYKMGKEVATATSKAGKRLFASTHSPYFVMGCIQSGSPVNIIRLTYSEKIATARLLANGEILRLMRNPLLRSVGVLDALFHEAVIVTESDTDRAFYQEINERLLRFKPEWGIPNCLFLNAQNKQTLHSILRPLRQMGIAAAAIADVDAFKDGGANWMNFLEGGNIPEIEKESLGLVRSRLKQAFDASGKDLKKDGGISVLQKADQEAAQNLLERLNEYGLFVVPIREVEHWLTDLQVRGKGTPWLIDVFERMGEDPDANEYVKPTEGDVWKFISTVKRWLANPLRKGIPD